MVRSSDPDYFVQLYNNIKNHNYEELDKCLANLDVCLPHEEKKTLYV